VWNLDQGSRSIRAGIRLRIPGLPVVSGIAVIGFSFEQSPRAPMPADCPDYPGVESETDQAERKLSERKQREKREKKSTAAAPQLGRTRTGAPRA
jgi:hypothetical protein